ncbi:MAG: tRNA lysidine(34) synthetase TilS [Solirubrobacterales bacterium]|nr:tRNA lysidine(34) synthetase TilS [Solirubrobacterales bacterium]
MSDYVLGVVRSVGLLQRGRPVVVLLSGGRDSTCLLDVASRIVGPGDVTALHVNYGLREEADDDESHCAELCSKLDVKLETRHEHPPPAGNIQAWARDARYSTAHELAAGHDIAAGHTASDQVETVLYRLASSPSRRALLGMRSREGALIRPLLSLTRAQTGEYCLRRGLEWREDSANESDAYARARIRKRLVPALREVHPAAEQNVLALAELLRDEADVLDTLIDQVLDDDLSISLVALRELDPALRRLLLQRLADAAAGAPAPGTARRVDEICALSNNAALDLPHGVRALVEGGVLRFVRQEPKPQARASAPSKID